MLGCEAWLYSGDAMRTINRRMALRLALFSGIASIAPTQRADAASAARIDADVRATLREFFLHVGGLGSLSGTLPQFWCSRQSSKRE